MRWRRLPIAAVLAGLLLTGCGQAPRPGDERPTGDPPSTGPQAPGNGIAPGEPDPSGHSPAISPEQAGRIVTDEFGGEVIDVEPDTAKGAPSWEVEVRGSDKGRIEVDVSRSTGEIVEMEVD